MRESLKHRIWRIIITGLAAGALGTALYWVLRGIGVDHWTAYWCDIGFCWINSFTLSALTAPRRKRPVRLHDDMIKGGKS